MYNKIKIVSWGDIDTGKPLFGVAVRKDGRWLNTFTGKFPDIFADKNDAKTHAKTLEKSMRKLGIWGGK